MGAVLIFELEYVKELNPGIHTQIPGYSDATN